MKNYQDYVCYSAMGVRLGYIRLKLNSDDLRKTFKDNIVLIKATHPGTAFIKLKKK